MTLKHLHVSPSADQKPAAWQEPVTLTLDKSGTIIDCSKSAAELFGYHRLELVLQHISKIVPQLSEIPLFRDGRFNDFLGFLAHCGHRFQVKSNYGMIFLGELFFVTLDRAGETILRLIIQPTVNAVA